MNSCFLRLDLPYGASPHAVDCMPGIVCKNYDQTEYRIYHVSLCSDFLLVQLCSVTLLIRAVLITAHGYGVSVLTCLGSVHHPLQQCRAAAHQSLPRYMASLYLQLVF